MASIQERTCQAANRAAVNVGFVVGEPATEEVAIRETTDRILDTFRTTQDLLLELEQIGERDELMRFLNSANHEVLQRSDQDSSAFIVSQIEMWHKAKLHQKTIEKLGDLLAVWKPKNENTDDFDQALRQLMHIVMLEPEKQAGQWATSGSVILPFRMRSLALVLAGLAVIACNNEVKDDREAYTGAMFGSSLVIDGMTRIVGVE